MADNTHLRGLESPPHRRERRDAERLKTDLRMSVSTEYRGGALMVTPASVHDISRSGALVLTRQWLTPFQNVMLALPAGDCPESMGLPQAFVGPAMVVRVHKEDETKHLAALRFGESLSDNPQFGVFVEFLRERGDKKTET